MAFSPPVSIGTGLAVAAIVYAIHSNFTPSMADMQGLPAGNADLDAAERKATFLSAGVVAGISLLAKDPTIFVVGSAAAIAMAWFSRSAIHTESKAGPQMVATSNLTSANDLSTGMTTADYQMFQASSDFGGSDFFQ